MKTYRTDIYEQITNQIIEALEYCSAWQRPWHTPEMVNVIPTNAKTGQQYRGINVLALWAKAQNRGYLNGLWATFQQWKELGATVKKGEKSCAVVFWGTIEKDNREKAGAKESSDSAEAETVLFARTYHVFNVSQVDGYEETKAEPLTDERIQHAESFFSGLGIVVHQASKAFYDSLQDSIHMPPFANFLSREGYYATLAHEVTHWTGHESRLNRDLKNRFGSEAYAMEELVAELGAAFICAELEIASNPREDHAAYIQSWLKVLKADKRAVFTAASKAQQAADWMKGLTTTIKIAA